MVDRAAHDRPQAPRRRRRAKAYDVVRGHGAETDSKKIEAEFHAGWIALRFLSRSTRRGRAFRQAAKIRRDADLGRARRLLAGPRGRGGRRPRGGPPRLRPSRRVSHHVLRPVGADEARPQRLAAAAPGAQATDALEKYEAVRGLRMLYEAGAGDLALPLLIDLAQRLDAAASRRPGRGRRILQGRPHHGAVRQGRHAEGPASRRRGFPIMGIPDFSPAGEPVEKPWSTPSPARRAYSTPRRCPTPARKGLMQLMPATAKRPPSRSA